MSRDIIIVSFPEPDGGVVVSLGSLGQSMPYTLEHISLDEYHRRMGDRASYIVRLNDGVPGIHIIQCIWSQFDRKGTCFSR